MLQGLTMPPRRILMTIDAVGGVWRYAMDLAAALRSESVETVFAGFGPAPSAHQRAEAEAIGTIGATARMIPVTVTQSRQND